MVMKVGVLCGSNPTRKSMSITMWMLAISCWVLTACNAIENKMDAPESQTQPDFIMVRGNATYLQRIAMPPDAVLTVRIEDVSRADVSATVLAETSEAFGQRQVPIPFSLKVPSNVIDPRLSYAVRATITVGDELRFTTMRNYAVLTRGAPNSADLILDAVQPATAQKTTSETASSDTPATAVGSNKVMAELKDTYWKLIELDGNKVTVAPTQKREVRITLASKDSRLIGFSGCNQLAGAYVQDGSKLHFTELVGTLMACVPTFMEIEKQVLKMLGATTDYSIEGGQLTLLGGNRVLARFEAVYLQ